MKRQQLELVFFGTVYSLSAAYLLLLTLNPTGGN